MLKQYKSLPGLPSMRSNPVALSEDVNDGWDGTASGSREEAPADKGAGDDGMKRSKTWRMRGTKSFGIKSGKQKKDRFKVSRFGTRKRREERTLENQDMIGASVTDNGHLIGSRADKLAMFEMDQFNVDTFAKAHFSSLSEKGVANLKSDLVALDAECAEEVRGTVHDQYMSFIMACQGIAELESSMQQLKDLLSASSAVVGSMKELSAAAPPSSTQSLGGAGGPGGLGRRRLFMDGGDSVDKSLPSMSASSTDSKAETEALSSLLEDLDVCIAKRCFQDSYQKFKLAQEVIASAFADSSSRSKRKAETGKQRKDTGHGSHEASMDPGQPAVQEQQAELAERHRTLCTLLEQHIQEPTCSAAEFESNIGVLASLAGEPAAARAMLDAIRQALKRQQMSLLKPYMSGTTGSTGDGTDYAVAAAQKLFSTIGTSLVRYRAIFGDKAELSSIFVAWAMKEAERCGDLVRRHALSAHASAGGLLASSQCVACVLTYSCHLEKQHGLSLTPHLMKSLWPALDSVIQWRLRRVADEVRQVVTEEIAGDRLANTADGSPPTSASLLAQEVHSMVSDVAFQMLNTLQLGRSLRSGISNLFHLYTSTIIRALRKRKKLEAGKDAAVHTAISSAIEQLAEEMLPRAVAEFKPLFGELCSKSDLDKHLAAVSDALADG
eukprot:CAMPEP_0117697972 /NCGR_PEP_ID=MMETSP0804-20121206/29521_1 /TAXON_ID=1074897 /ORGANISM="Tetraselmis astigmatica, Strain CCMP880" /LENGTH=666 /DNA_ID=CAMNT_0005512273 /DNA_START=100 /DNA_END=2100 /DNA_ORIENTATION=+